MQKSVLDEKHFTTSTPPTLMWKSAIGRTAGLPALRWHGSRWQAARHEHQDRRLQMLSVPQVFPRFGWHCV
jgi:hypothetical protein